MALVLLVCSQADSSYVIKSKRRHSGFHSPTSSTSSLWWNLRQHQHDITGFIFPHPFTYEYMTVNTCLVVESRIFDRRSHCLSSASISTRPDSYTYGQNESTSGSRSRHIDCGCEATQVQSDGVVEVMAPIPRSSNTCWNDNST